MIGDGPSAVHAVVKGLLEAVGVCVPDANRAILTARDDDRQCWMEAHRGDIVYVTLERLYAGLVLIVPNLDRAVDSDYIQITSISMKQLDESERERERERRTDHQRQKQGTAYHHR